MSMTLPERTIGRTPGVDALDGVPTVVLEDGGASAAMVALYIERRANLVRMFAAKLGPAAAEDLVQDI